MKRLFGRIKNLLSADTTGLADDPVNEEQFIAEARQWIETGQADKVFPGLNRLKARRTPVRNLDFLRAQCFLKARQPSSATEALREELRYFPDNEEASRLLAEVSQRKGAVTSLGDTEFQQLFRMVQDYTMVGEKRLLSLYALAKQVCEDDLPGNFAECGVAAGGSSGLLAAVISRHSRRPRLLFSLDTFEGMPEPGRLDTHHRKSAEAIGWGEGTCAAPESSLLDVCRRLGVERIVRPVKGLFADTLPLNRERIGRIALLHVDGDWYSSTKDVLENAYDLVVPGGRIQIDDYGYWQGCERAVSEFATQRGLKFYLQAIDDTGVWFQKSFSGSGI